jgi:hypothetical protein
MNARSKLMIMAFFTALAVSLTTAVGQSGERAQRLVPPTSLPPLQQDWKEFVYEAVNKHVTAENRKMNVRYLFLDSPVPCTASFGRKGFLGIGFGKAVQQGYGGVFLKKSIDSFASFTRKRKSVEKDATAYFYLILPGKGTVEVYSVEQMNGGVVEPPVITVETTNFHHGNQYGHQIKFHAIMSPTAKLEADAFRAIADVEAFDQWPPYK